MATNKSLLTLALLTSTLASADISVDVSGTVGTTSLDETVIIKTNTATSEDTVEASNTKEAEHKTDKMSLHCAIIEETETGATVALDIMMVQDGDEDGGVTMINPSPVEVKWGEETRVGVRNFEEEMNDAVTLTITARKQ